MLTESTWNEFQDAGLVWWMNRILHLFGWAIVLEQDEESGEIKRVYPAKTNFRGFPADVEANGFHKLTNHLRDEMPKLVRDAGG